MQEFKKKMNDKVFPSFKPKNIMLQMTQKMDTIIEIFLLLYISSKTLFSKKMIEVVQTMTIIYIFRTFMSSAIFNGGRFHKVRQFFIGLL